MESDDDLHNSDDLELLEDDFFGEDIGALNYEDDGSDDGAGDCGLLDDYLLGFDDDPCCQQQNYTILSEADIRKLQDEDVTRLSNLLYTSRSDACNLLRHYNWNATKVHDEWFADEGNVRKVVGLLETPAIVSNSKEVLCGICFETYLHHEMSAATCGHQFCHECWRGYIGTSVSDGPGCLMLRCPAVSCSAAVGQNLINLLARGKDKEKYSSYLLRSFVEDSRKRKWCPAPGCNFAVSLDFGSAEYDVCCKCKHTFCWNCKEDAHRPVACETVTKWILKNSSESENMNWILVHSKPCPKCKRPIEKNHGCHHMRCAKPCNFQFCWSCLGAWSEHGYGRSCNAYRAAKQEGVIDEAEKRERAKTSLDRYMHYYERWATNQSSRLKALAVLESMQNYKLKKLSRVLGIHVARLHFVTEAWEQIVECRRALKWTYAYGYYIPEYEVKKRQFFEYLQGNAESGLERLHKCAEKDLQFLLAKNPSGTSMEFNALRNKLAGLTRVTRKYFKNLVDAMENGLQEVEACPAPVEQASKPTRKRGRPKKTG